MTAATAGAERVERRGPGIFGGWSLAASLFVVPAVFLLVVFMLYPVVQTIILSFEPGLDELRAAADRRPQVPGPRARSLPRARCSTTCCGSSSTSAGPSSSGSSSPSWRPGFATRPHIKAIVFIPQAIAAVALGVIWRFVYFPRPTPASSTRRSAWPASGPISWLGSQTWVNSALIIAGIWGSVGFVTVILSAALKGISTEILEAARVDGATEGQVFRRIIVPMLSLPISVVAVTLVINVIKLFDLIYTMTQGGPANSSRVIAFSMYQEALPARNFDYGAAIAVIMLIILIPVMIFNVRRFTAERVTA